MLHRVCAIHGAAGGESQDYPALTILSCVQTTEENQQQKRNVFQDAGQSSSFLYLSAWRGGGVLITASDYLEYHIYGKVTYKVILDTS